MDNSRRSVLRWLAMGLGTLGAVLPLGWRRSFAQTKGEKIGTLADLEKAGFLAGTLADKTPVLVFKDPKDAKALVAFNATCSHAGCATDYKDSAMVCPCHGSRFALDGSVARGPARQPLKPLTVTIDAGQILVSA